MKNEIKKLQLVEMGLSSKTVAKLSEKQIHELHSKMIREQVTQINKPSYEIKGSGTLNTPMPKGATVTKKPDGTVTVTPNEGEIGEDDSDSAFEDDAMQLYTGQDSPHDESDMAPDGMDDDSDGDRKMMGMSESRKKKNKKEPNPWAICHAQVGPKKTRKFERCVMAVKKSLKEGKNPVSLFLENEIMRIVEKHIPPRITKGDLIKYLSEDTTTKPKTKPGTKTPPKEKPHDPFKPSPHKQPKPKAEKKETKESVMDAPAKPKERPTVKPGTKTPPKPKPFDPFKPDPNKQPAPKAGTKKLPEWLSFKSMGIKLK